MSFQLSRLPRTDDELYWYIRARYGLTIPRTPVCPDHVTPFRAFADAFFRRNSINPEYGVDSIALWHGSRGLSGKSRELSVLGTALAELLGCDVNLLGGSLAQSMNVKEYIDRDLGATNAPRYMVEDLSVNKIDFTSGSRIRPLTASQKTVRGPHPPRLLLDEIDEMELAILWAALGQPMEQPNYLGEVVLPYSVLCSTWQNAQGTFTEILREAELKGWPIYRWCYRESANPVDGWLTERAIQEKRNTISEAMWDSEYELNEPSGGARAIASAAVEACFSLPFAPIRKEEGKDFWEYAFEDPIRGAQYVSGADWAKEQDYTVIAVGRVDVTPWRLVYFARMNRRPYPFMIGYFNRALSRYRASAWHDSTGLGDVIDDLVDRRASGFSMTGEKRDDMLTEYVVALEKESKWRFPQETGSYLEHKYAQVGDFYSRKQTFHLPDTCAAFALMHHAAKNRPELVAPVAVGAGPSRSARELAARASGERRAGDVSVERIDRDVISFVV